MINESPRPVTANRQERRRQEKLDRKAGKPSPKIRARLKSGIDAYEIGDIGAAETAFREVLDAHPNDPVANHYLGLVEYRTGRFADAADHMIQAAMEDGFNADLHANLASVLTLLGRGAEAEAASRHVLELRPDDAEALNSLSVALELQGKAEAALEAGGRALELAPEFLQACINLGNLQFRQGDFSEAERYFRRAIEIAPSEPMPHANLAIVLRRNGDLTAAASAAKAAISAMPSYAEGHNTLGTILQDLGDFDGALSAFEAALDHKPGLSEAQANLAAARYKLGDLDAAVEAYRKLAEAPTPFAEAWSGMGIAQLALGDTDAAVQSFRRAVELKAGLGEAWVNLSAAGPLDAEDVGIIDDQLDGGQLSEADRAQLEFALGLHHDRVGDTDAAMAAFVRGNDVRRNHLAGLGLTFDADAYAQKADATIKAFTRETLAGVTGADDSETPVFIVGMPRSGTTLVEQILASHSSVESAGELDLMRRAIADPKKALADVAALADDLLGQLTMGRSEATRVIDKAPFGFEALGLVAAIFPKAKVVHITRNPDDVALSCFMTNFGAGHPWSTRIEHIRAVQAAELRLMAHWKGATDLAIKTVVYEDLVKDQAAESQALIDFLGLDWEEACLTPHARKGAVLTASNWQVRKPVYRDAVGRAARYGKLLAGG